MNCLLLQPNHALIELLEKGSSSSHKKPSHHVDVFEEVRRLIQEQKANANSQNKKGYTALQLAVRNGHYECLTTLIKDGNAKLHKKGPYVFEINSFPLHFTKFLLDKVQPPYTNVVY